MKGLSVTEVGQTVDLVTPQDWISQFSGTSFERGTLLRMVGFYTLVQTAVGTLVDVPKLFLIIHLLNDLVTVVADPGSKAALAGEDILSMQAWPLQGASLDQASISQQRWPIDINTKRKLTSQDVIAMTGRVSTDTASPSVGVTFYGRALIDRS